MHQDGKIEHWEVERVNTHIQMANYRFGNIQLHHYHQVVQVAFWAEMASVLVWAVCRSRLDTHLPLGTTRVS